MSIIRKQIWCRMFFGSIFPHHGLSDAERAKILADPGFGRFFSDHMSIIYWDANKGWHGAFITELRPFTLRPGCVALHYAQGAFEGLKAYGRADGSVRLFRPLLNVRRFCESAVRLALPQLTTTSSSQA
jgi:branched-chain amino acid aminotransferase